MKKIILNIVGFLIFAITVSISCDIEPIFESKSEASMFQTKQGKPSKDNFFKGGTFTQSILMDAQDYGLVFNNLSEYQQTGSSPGSGNQRFQVVTAGAKKHVPGCGIFPLQY